MNLVPSGSWNKNMSRLAWPLKKGVNELEVHTINWCTEALLEPVRGGPCFWLFLGPMVSDLNASPTTWKSEQ